MSPSLLRGPAGKAGEETEEGQAAAKVGPIGYSLRGRQEDNWAHPAWQ